MVAVHELTHGFAHMYMSHYLGLENYIKTMEENVNSKIKMTTSKEFDLMLDTIGKLGKKGGKENQPFSDGHFRLFGDGFSGSYSDLNIKLLLSYQLIAETMIEIKSKHPGIDISELLTITVRELVNNKALNRDFVIGRIIHFLPRLYQDFA